MTQKLIGLGERSRSEPPGTSRGAEGRRKLKVTQWRCVRMKRNAHENVAPPPPPLVLHLLSPGATTTQDLQTDPGAPAPLRPVKVTG